MFAIVGASKKMPVVKILENYLEWKNSRKNQKDRYIPNPTKPNILKIPNPTIRERKVRNVPKYPRFLAILIDYSTAS